MEISFIKKSRLGKSFKEKKMARTTGPTHRNQPDKDYGRKNKEGRKWKMPRPLKGKSIYWKRMSETLKSIKRGRWIRNQKRQEVAENVLRGYFDKI